MDNYIIGLLPAVQPEDDMKIELGGVMGSVTLSELKKFIKGSGSATTGLVLNPSAVTITASDFVNVGIDFEISGSPNADLGYHWLITGIDENSLISSYSDNQDKANYKLKSVDLITAYPLGIKIQAGDENWDDEQYATITVTQ